MAALANYPSLAGKTVFITGGATGIGAALVRSFVAQGAKVAFVDIQQEAAQLLCESLLNSDYKPLFINCNLKDVEQIKAAVQRVEKHFGGIDVLLNNAANDTRHAIEEVTSESWDNCLAINLKPAFFTAQAVLQKMKIAGGSIINFGSISWMTKQGGMPGYTTAKAAIHGLTRSLASDFGPFNIRVNTLVPGWVMTQRQLDNWVDEDAKKLIAYNQCLNTALVPQDIANMALFLAADDSSMISAQSFNVDAGWV